MTGEQHDCPNFNNRFNNQDNQQTKPNASILSSESVKFMDTLGPAVAETLRLSQDTNKKVTEVHEAFLKSRGESVA